MDVLATAEQLKNELDALRPLNADAEARIMQKFRLDWNYHSNNLEGNSLTYGETKALILFGITAQGKPLKDHFEITGHNEAINWIIEMIKGETDLSEVFIRQLHQLLLKESYEVEAQTPNGKSTKRRIVVGKYKTQPNHVLTQTGETFYFATPEETPAKMQELIEWLRREKDKPEANPIILAALFHYKFIRIHPFDDGNGRVARILMNFILMQYGYPPVIIKTNDKENYFSVLQQADAGIFEPFVEYIADNSIRSLEIMIKGAKGESIEEPEDLDKELALLDKRFESISHKLSLSKNQDNLSALFEKTVKHLAEEFIKNCKKFDKFYTETDLYLFSYRDYSSPQKINKLHDRLIEIIKRNPINLSQRDSRIRVSLYRENDLQQLKENLSVATHGLVFYCIYNSFNRETFQSFDTTSAIFIKFGETKYAAFSMNDENGYEKPYSDYLSEEEIKNLISSEAKAHLFLIKEKTNQA